ncbi:MAG TPA: bifunctional nuclease [Prevotella sp.]|nr:bifunctional nuclease [Prevotella sp.]
MNRIRLLFNNVSKILGNENIGLIVLTDELKTRQISIICDKNTREAIDMRIGKMPGNKEMLPEVLTSLLKAKVEDKYEIDIEDVANGQYVTIIQDISNGDTFRVKASQAILLSIISGIPIYTTKELMQKQSNVFLGRGEKLSLPINVVTNSMLEESLKKAIEEENYEIASRLSEELKKRKNKDHTI